MKCSGRGFGSQVQYLGLQSLALGYGPLGVSCGTASPRVVFSALGVCPSDPFAAVGMAAIAVNAVAMNDLRFMLSLCCRLCVVGEAVSNLS